jgi:hypothetical protein
MTNKQSCGTLSCPLQKTNDAMGLFKIIELGKPDLKFGVGALTCSPLKIESIQGIHMIIRQYWVVGHYK